jgi:outer membrane receptor for ferrienterochelin and colicins
MNSTILALAFLALHGTVPPPAGHAPEDFPSIAADTIPSDTVIAVRGVIVRSTRTGQRVQDDPIRVEIVEREEIEEKLLMRPGSIAMLLAEMGGIRLQTTSAGLGSSVVRIQGMPARYVLLLQDGLPLHGGTPGGLGVLQIPPADLEQVEVIKGSASALYGGEALGGVVNLVSRRPGDEAALELILNGTSRGGADAVAYVEAPLAGRWSGSALLGGHRQGARDLDGSGWADLTAHDRGTLRLRAFREGEAGRSLLLTAGFLAEDRAGGTLPGRTLPPGEPWGGVPFPDAQDTRHLDGGLHYRAPVFTSSGTTRFMELRASGMRSRGKRRFGARDGSVERDNLFAEASLAGISGAHTWVVGGGIRADRFGHLDRARPEGDWDLRGVREEVSLVVPGIFLQDEIRFSAAWTGAASLRVDHHSEFGTLASPRLSLLHRPGPWTIRGAVGGGFHGAPHLHEELEAVGWFGVAWPLPLGAELEPERGWSASLDAGRTFGRLEGNAALFSTRTRNPIVVEPGDEGLLVFGNGAGDLETLGAELLLRYRVGDVTLTGSHVLVDARWRPEEGGPRERTPLVPRNQSGLVAVWEDHDRGLLGLELYRTGRQRLEPGAPRSESRAWVHAGILGELRLGETEVAGIELAGWSVFLNLENLLDVRQTRWDPIFRTGPLLGRGPATDVWAPLEGFTMNLGVRIRVGGGHDDHHHDHP